MYLRDLLRASCLTLAFAEPLAAPFPAPLALRRSIGLKHDHELKQRPLSEGDSVCWSDGSICDTWGELDDNCDVFELVSDDWYECICSSGWVAAHEACNWCLREFNEIELSDDSTWTEACDRESLSISPMPPSILAMQSSFNATNTWLHAEATGGLAASPTSDAEPASETGDSEDSSSTTTFRAGGTGVTFPSQTSSSSRSSSARQTSTTTMFGGDAETPLTTSDENVAEATVTVTAGAGGAAGGAGGSAAGLDAKEAAMISGLVALLAMVGVARLQF